MESTKRRAPASSLPVIAAAAVFASAFLTATAFANAAGMFESLDVDDNGRLVRQELERHPALMARFSRVDEDRDGSLSLSEFERLLTLPGAVPSLE